jgi:1,4-alpha-glucan branching enzyme
MTVVSDPNRFQPTLGDVDLHLFSEGKHHGMHQLLGAHLREIDGVAGTSFAVWAPNATSVSVIGDFCHWQPDEYPLRSLGSSGVHECFVPGLGQGTLYKFAIRTRSGEVLKKTDPCGRFTEQPPGHASIVVPPSSYAWQDGDWLSARARSEPVREPVSIYEVHLGSWLPADMNPTTYDEIAAPLVERVAELGFTHVEFMPLMEHPFGGSWGYQVTGYFAPTSRWGDGDALRYLIDSFHARGLGVILDWVPAHFPDDEHGLHRFDGTALYEHEDPRRGHHPDWDTSIFNYGRHEVSNFLLCSALHWIEEFHVDGLRVDAVASMLHLDYSRPEGEWIPNEHGGSENIDAVNLLKRINQAVHERFPGCLMIAEESTTWPGVTAPVEQGGLGFDLKWNLGWMHDTLEYFAVDPIFREHHNDKLTFSMIYENTEQFLMPLSHDEVVHGKGSLLNKMHGDDWQRFANLRAMLTYQFTRPGKQLLFMGTELASSAEWNHDGTLDWHLAEEPLRRGLQTFLQTLHALYREHPCLWRSDPDPAGFEWICCEDRAQAVFTYLRHWEDQHLLVALNLTPVPRSGYRIGVPDAPGTVYRCLLNSDAGQFAGSDSPGQRDTTTVEASSIHSRPSSIVVDLPPLAALVLGA